MYLAVICICLANCKKAPERKADETLSGTKTGPAATSALPAKPNVLFIIVDDLRYWTIKRLWEDDLARKADNSQPYTPNIDGLIDQSVTFTRAYAPGVECTPSRTAFLSGRRPETTGIYRVGNNWDAVIGTNQTIVKRFIDAGYLVNGAGKIFHGPTQNDYWYGTQYKETSAGLQSVVPIAGMGGAKKGYIFDVINDVDESSTEDYKAVTFSIDRIQDAKNSNPQNKPFFVACGIRRPHNPLIVPQKYLQYHPISGIITPQVVPSDMTTVPVMARDLANDQGCGAIMSPDELQQTDPTYWKKYLQSYMANVSYVDAQVGRLLRALENNGFANNTIVVMISDHGVHLGEKHHVHKTTLWEETTRVPMIWRVPGTAAAKCRVPVSLMDIYKTFQDYCNLGNAPLTIEADNIRNLIEAPATSSSGHYAVTSMNFKASSVQGSPWQLIQYNQDTAKEELYHRELDPWNGTNRSSDPGNAPLILLRSKLPTTFAAQVGSPSCD